MTPADPTSRPPASAEPSAEGAWALRLLEQMEVGDVRPDLDGVARLGAAARETHPEDLDAGTSAAFIAGYAAGLAEGTGQADFERAHRASLRALERMIGAERDGRQGDRP